MRNATLHMTMLALIVSASLGCGPGVEIDKVAVKGAHVVLRIDGLHSEDEVTLGNVEGEHLDYRSIRFGVEHFGAGPHSEQLTVTRDGKSREIEVSFDVPKSALDPYAKLLGCTRNRPGGGDLTITGDFGATKDSPYEQCHLTDEGKLGIRFATQSDATLRHGDETFEAKEGEVWVHIDVAPLFHLVRLHGKMRREAALQWETSLEVSRKELKAKLGKIQLHTEPHDVSRALSHQLAKAASGDGKLSWPHTPRAADSEARVVVLHVTEAKAPKGKAKTATGWQVWGKDDVFWADELDLVAIGTPRNVHQRGRCHFNMGDPISTRRNVYDLDIVVRDRAGKEVAKKSFPGGKAKCPTSVAGNRGETVNIFSGPKMSDVGDWLQGVRKGAH